MGTKTRNTVSQGYFHGLFLFCTGERGGEEKKTCSCRISSSKRNQKKKICEFFSKWNSSSETCLSPGPNYLFVLQLITLILHRSDGLLRQGRNLNRMIFQLWFYLQTVVCQFEEKPESETETPVFSSCYNWNLSRQDSNVRRCSLQRFGPFPSNFQCWCIKH